MSITFMTECHTFIQLDSIPIDEAISRIYQYIDNQPTYGFVGCDGDHGDETYQWRPGDDWEPKVRSMLTTPRKVYEKTYRTTKDGHEAISAVLDDFNEGE